MIEILHIKCGICNQATSRLDPIYNTICAELKDKDPKEFKNIIKQKILEELYGQ